MAVNDVSDKSISFISSLSFRVCVSVVSHPVEYAKFLIQIGHEPLPTFPTRTLFGRPAHGLPNVFQYVKFIKDTDGLLGCYRGFLPKVTGQILGGLVAKDVVENLKLNVNYGFNVNEDELSEEERLLVLKQTLLREIVGRSVTVVVSQPFIVVSSRMMAEFVGGENVYTGVFASISEIFKKEGIFGFYAGFLPRWIGEMVTLIVSSLVIFGVNSYLISDRDLSSYIPPAVQYIANSFTYPFTVVSSCMAINNCGLLAGIPPEMPIYKDWISCWKNLSKNGQLNRGSSLVFRYYFGPTRGHAFPPAY